jgi:hypothetical protein
LAYEWKGEWVPIICWCNRDNWLTYESHFIPQGKFKEF